MQKDMGDSVLFDPFRESRQTLFCRLLDRFIDRAAIAFSLRYSLHHLQILSIPNHPPGANDAFRQKGIIAMLLVERPARGAGDFHNTSQLLPL